MEIFYLSCILLYFSVLFVALGLVIDSAEDREFPHPDHDSWPPESILRLQIPVS